MIVVQRLARGLQTKPTAMPVVRELIRRLKSLPEHAWRTQRLAGTTLATRHAIEVARSPERLLFQELPAVFGLTPFAEDDWSVGSALRVGELEFSVVSPVVRCVATHVNPTSGETDIDLVEQLRTVFDRTTMGTYLAVARGGLLKVGDEMKAS